MDGSLLAGRSEAEAKWKEQQLMRAWDRRARRRKRRQGCGCSVHDCTGPSLWTVEGGVGGDPLLEIAWWAKVATSCCG